MDTECRKKYQYNTSNKSELLKTRASFNGTCVCISFKHLISVVNSTEVLLDQLPMLGALRRAMEELAIMDPPDPQPSVVLEQV
jgi:hypothetical protein